MQSLIARLGYLKIPRFPAVWNGCLPALCRRVNNESGHIPDDKPVLLKGALSGASKPEVAQLSPASVHQISTGKQAIIISKAIWAVNASELL